MCRSLLTTRASLQNFILSSTYRSQNTIPLPLPSSLFHTLPSFYSRLIPPLLSAPLRLFSYLFGAKLYGKTNSGLFLVQLCRYFITVLDLCFDRTFFPFLSRTCISYIVEQRCDASCTTSKAFNLPRENVCRDHSEKSAMSMSIESSDQVE